MRRRLCVRAHLAAAPGHADSGPVLRPLMQQLKVTASLKASQSDGDTHECRCSDKYGIRSLCKRTDGHVLLIGKLAWMEGGHKRMPAVALHPVDAANIIL